jgi:hypothetical protein
MAAPLLQDRSPPDAADQAAVSAFNVRPAADRLRRRKIGPWLKSHTGTKNKVTREKIIDRGISATIGGPNRHATHRNQGGINASHRAAAGSVR